MTLAPPELRLHLRLILLLNVAGNYRNYLWIFFLCVLALNNSATKLSWCRFFCTVRYYRQPLFSYRSVTRKGFGWSKVETDVSQTPTIKHNMDTTRDECDNTFYFYMNYCDAAPQTKSERGIIRAPIYEISISMSLYLFTKACFL